MHHKRLMPREYSICKDFYCWATIQASLNITGEYVILAMWKTDSTFNALFSQDNSFLDCVFWD